MNQVLEAREDVCDCVREDEEMRQSFFSECGEEEEMVNDGRRLVL